jgi:hypothetical protein
MSQKYPDIYGSCGTDQACPMCHGLDHAIRDKAFLEPLDEAKMELWAHNDAKSRIMESSEANATQDGPLYDYKNDILSDSMVDHLQWEELELTKDVSCAATREKEKWASRNGIQTRLSAC